MKKVLALNSGGLDSALMCKKLHDDGFEVVSLYVDTGELNRVPAMAAAKETADRYCVQHIVQVIDYGRVPNYLYDQGTGEYWNYDEAVANGKWAEYLTGTTNLIHGVKPAHWHTNFGMAFAWCQMLGITEFYSACKDNIATAEWINLFKQMPGEANWPTRNAIPMTPVQDKDAYADVKSWASVTTLDDFKYTHSCRQATPCGWCDKCKKREEAGCLQS